MTIKTPQEIAAEQMGAFTITDGDVEECSVGFIADAIAEAIEADRKQRDPNEDGTIHGAAIIALGERAESDHDEAEGYEYRGRAAEWIENNPDEFWESYAGPMLDEVERAHGYGSEARECSRCGAEPGFAENPSDPLNSDGECVECANATRCPNCGENTDEEDGRERFKNWCTGCVHDAERSGA